jgi:osmotically-inducible protein OsmY
MRTLVRLVLVAVVVIVAVVVLQDTWNNLPWRRDAGSVDSAPAGTDRSVGTGGYIGTQKAREVGAEIGEKTAIAARELKENTQKAAITAKIKAKMALDEMVKARAIDVTTDDSTVILTGSVASAAERERAVALARETSGVTEVVDRLTIR